MVPAECALTASFPPLRIYPLDLTLVLGPGRERLPPFLGSALRGLIASGFRRMVCVTGAPVCDGCFLVERCPYPFLFETTPPPEAPISLRQRYLQAPRPYVLGVPQSYRGEAELGIRLVLMGQAVEFLPYLIATLTTIGSRGIGKARVPFDLQAVTASQNGEVIYNATSETLCPAIQPLDPSDLVKKNDTAAQRLTVECVTPLRIKKYGDYQASADRLDFPVLMDLLLGRLEALCTFHGESSWTVPPGIREAARRVKVVRHELSLHQLERYSNRQGRKLPLHGLVSRVTVEGEVGSLLPILRLGTFLHLGAGTAFGLGRYRLEVE